MPIRAFNLSFDRPEYDEQPIAREMAARAHAEFVTIPITQEDLAESLPDAVWHSEQPFFNSHGVAKFRLSRAVREQGSREQGAHRRVGRRMKSGLFGG